MFCGVDGVCIAAPLSEDTDESKSDNGGCGVGAGVGAMVGGAVGSIVGDSVFVVVGSQGRKTPSAAPTPPRHNKRKMNPATIMFRFL